MFTRMLILTLIAMLVLPAATLTPPGETSQAPWSDVTAAAKGKKHKQNGKKRKTTTVTRAVRGPVTRNFTSTGPITIPNGAPGTTKGAANPYPSAIAVTGLPNGVITDVNLILNDLTHPHHDDLDILLSSSDGRRALVMSDAGDISNVTDIDLTLDDEAAESMPGGEGSELGSGTFRPTNIDRFDDVIAAPAPTPNGTVALSTFDGADPNGTWHLWVMDNGNGSYGDIGGGWAVQITAEVDLATFDEQVPSGKDTKKHKRKRRR